MKKTVKHFTAIPRSPKRQFMGLPAHPVTHENGHIGSFPTAGRDSADALARSGLMSQDRAFGLIPIAVWQPASIFDTPHAICDMLRACNLGKAIFGATVIDRKKHSTKKHSTKEARSAGE
jgi:hypothetical protein